MKTYIILLRGINVGGHKKIKMADLRHHITSLGYNHVKTYIQSGNIILDSEEGKATVSQKISKNIMLTYGFEVPVLVLDIQDWRAILENCPFEKIKMENAYFTILFEKPQVDNIRGLETINYPNEEFILKHTCVYFHSTKGYGNAKYNNNLAERKLGVTATSRNYKTMIKLLDIATSRDS